MGKALSAWSTLMEPGWSESALPQIAMQLSSMCTDVSVTVANKKEHTVPLKREVRLGTPGNLQARAILAGSYYICLVSSWTLTSFWPGSFRYVINAYPTLCAQAGVRCIIVCNPSIRCTKASKFPPMQAEEDRTVAQLTHLRGTGGEQAFQARLQASLHGVRQVASSSDHPACMRTFMLHAMDWSRCSLQRFYRR